MNKHYQFDSPEQLQELVDRLFIQAEFSDCHALLQGEREEVLDGSDELEGWYFLRLGQVLLELGRPADAKRALTRAFSKEGFEVFENEDEKYLEHIKDFVEKRLKRYRISSYALLLLVLMFIASLGVAELLGFNRETLYSPWVFGAFFVVFIALMLIAASLSPYRRDSGPSGEDGELGPVD